jgi:RimJ/RimL family protein N-acetyltransferase
MKLLPITAGFPAEIRTARLTLRPIRDDDLDPLHAMLGDIEVMRYWSSLPHESRAQTRDWIAANRAAVAAGTAIECGAEYRSRLIGRVIFWNGNELGYIFDKAHWGQGFAGEAVAAMIDRAFATQDWDAITADIDPRNLASGNLLRRLGFQPTSYKERTFCIGGEWSDSQYFALSRTDWRARAM